MKDLRGIIEDTLADNGVQPNVDAMHSWRCDDPERYPGYCSCVPQLVDELVIRIEARYQLIDQPGKEGDGR